MPQRPSEAILNLAPPRSPRRILYGTAREQFGELWLPEGGAVASLVVFFHGGYWRARYDLTHTGFACQALAGAGFAVWNVEYRRVGNPGGGWPGTFEDVLAALRSVQRLADRFPLDAQRVLLCGHSAGGHLALWAGAQASRGQVFVPGLRAVVALAPISDLHEAWQQHLSQDAVVELLGGTPAEVGERYLAASPARLLPLGAPQELIHGKIDDTVPFAMSERYAVQSVAAGDRVALAAPESCGHFDLIDPQSGAWPVVLDTITKSLDRSPRAA